MSTISDKINERLKNNHGISSDDIGQIVSENRKNGQDEEKQDARDTVDEVSTVKAEKPESHDAVLSTSVSELDSKNFFLGLLGAINLTGRVEITPDDKSKFIAAVLSGERMKSSFSFFGGKLTFTIKNRSYEEARAAMSMAVKGGTFNESSTLLTLRLRLMLMCMQIDEFNGVKYPDADTLGPLMPVYDNGETKQPKWLDRLSVFGRLPEAMFEALWQCIYEFEQKYWTLVRHSRDQDFWRPE